MHFTINAFNLYICESIMFASVKPTMLETFNLKFPIILNSFSHTWDIVTYGFYRFSHNFCFSIACVLRFDKKYILKFIIFYFRLWFVMFFLALGVLSVVAFVLLGFFYAFFTSGFYWDIYGYVVIFHILSAPLWSFELCVWLVIQATLNKLQKGSHSNPNTDLDDISSTHFSTKLWIV